MSREPELRWTVPNSWTWTRLSELGDIVAGGTPSTKEPSYWADEVHWISPSDLTGYSAKTIKRGAKSISRIGLANSSAKVMPAGSVHFSSRAPIGYVVISAEALATNQGFKSLVPAPGIFNKYVYYYLLASREYAHKRASGTTFLELSGKAFGCLPIPLAPTATQHRIVARIEKLFSKLDKGVESLKTARAQLKVYRQAVLKHAFEGKLTAQWREENKDKLEKPEQLLARIKQEREARYERQLQEWRIAVKEWEGKGKPGKKPGKPMPLKSVWQIDSSKIKRLPSIPDGWQWVPFSWLLSTEKKSIKTGPFGTMLKKHEHQEVGVPVLGIENIGGGRFIKGNKIFVSEKKAVALSSFEVEPGELIISRSGTVGEICTVPEGLGKTLISTNLLRVSLNQNVVLSQIFVFMFQGGGTVRKQVKELCKGSSRDFLNQSILQSVVFPICSLQEQIQIIREIGKRLSLTDQLLRSIDSELVKSSSLRQSILKKAFSGQLVAQDPSDEPASVLLARIKAEKEQIGKKTETT